jgi:ferredoxin-NADP reductase
VRRVEGGRFSSWAFSAMKVGDEVKARGPLGTFTMRSRPETPLLFVAGGTGIAPVLALLEQQARIYPQRDMLLLWGMNDTADFYALDTLRSLLERAPRLRVMLVTEHGAPLALDHPRMAAAAGNVVEAIARERSLLDDRDLYAAGPSPMLRVLGQQLDRWAVSSRQVHMDSFSV